MGTEKPLKVSENLQRKALKDMYNLQGQKKLLESSRKKQKACMGRWELCGKLLNHGFFLEMEVAFGKGEAHLSKEEMELGEADNQI